MTRIHRYLQLLYGNLPTEGQIPRSTVQTRTPWTDRHGAVTRCPEVPQKIFEMDMCIVSV
jgi:hypothetical protein